MGKVPSTVPVSVVSPRFQIASRLGGFRDTCTVSDPFGTSARFTIIRNGSNAHKAWFRSRLDSNPEIMLIAERAMVDDASLVPLTADEQKTVDAARPEQNPTIQSLLGVVDRLSTSSVEQNLRKSAMRSLLTSGKLKPSDWMTRGEDEQLAEAVFVLSGWEDMPDDSGGVVPFDQDAATALLTLDIPMGESGIDLLAVEAWTVDIDRTGKEPPAGVPLSPIPPGDDGLFHWKEKIPNPLIQTVGQAYQLYFLHASRQRSLFRDQLVDAAGKNSDPSSDSTISSGDGQKTDEPAN